MAKSVKTVAVTGGAGQIAYSLLFRLASGELWGQDQPISLRILEVPQGLAALEGVVMELEDCGFPTLAKIEVGSDPEKLFADAQLAILVGAKPRGPGMERKDLLAENGALFAEQGRALGRVAAKDVLVFVVGNPCNTNCLIAMHHAPNLAPNQFHAMTRLDQHRARFQLAKRAHVGIVDVERVAIWGNHSATQVPDFVNATIHKKPATEVIRDRQWLENAFVTTIQKRGSAVIAARGKSSAASAAQAILDSLRSLFFREKSEHIFSSCILSDGNPYGIRDGLIFSFPCCYTGEGRTQIATGFTWDDFLQKKIALTEQELVVERDAVMPLLQRGGRS